MTRRDVREFRQGIHGMVLVWALAAALAWLASSCAPDPVYAQTPPDGTAAPIPQLPVITGVRFAWPTPHVRAKLAAQWRNDREFGACVMHIAVFVRDTDAVREETWVIDSIVLAKSRIADQSTLVDSICPDSTLGFIHSHPLSRVCNLSQGDVLGGGLFRFAISGVVCGPDGAIGFWFNPLLPPIAPAPAARLPPDTSTRAPNTSVRSAPDEGSGR